MISNSELGVSGGECCTFSVKSTTVQSSPIHTKSRGKRMPFIQNEDVCPLWNMNSIPVRSSRLSRSPSPLLRSSGVSAISTKNVAPAIVSLGPAGSGVSVGSGVGVGSGVDVAVGSAVAVGAVVGVGSGVFVVVGIAVLVGLGALVGDVVGDASAA